VPDCDDTVVVGRKSGLFWAKTEPAYDKEKSVRRQQKRGLSKACGSWLLNFILLPKQGKIGLICKFPFLSSSQYNMAAFRIADTLSWPQHPCRYRLFCREYSNLSPTMYCIAILLSWQNNPIRD